MGSAVVGVVAILTLIAALVLCYVGEGRLHPELEDHDWYRG